MSSYTICPELLEYSKENREYISDILMAFIPSNSKKICLDSGDLLLNKYKEIISEDKDLSDWLRFMSFNMKNTFEKVEIGNEFEVSLPLEICNRSFDKQLIVHERSIYSEHKKYIEKNEIKLLEKDLAKYLLNYSTDILSSNELYQKIITPENVYNIVFDICSEFKCLIENNGLFKLLVTRAGKRVHESYAQLIFFGVAHSICKANDLKLSPEVDSGNGPVDFNLSNGFKANVNIEVKFADNPKLISGFYSQLDIYNKAEHTNKSIFLIIKTDNKSDTKIDELLKGVDKEKAAGKVLPNIIIVDSTFKESASVR